MYEISVAFRGTRNMQSMHRGNYFYSCMCIHVEALGENFNPHRIKPGWTRLFSYAVQRFFYVEALVSFVWSSLNSTFNVNLTWTYKIRDAGGAAIRAIRCGYDKRTMLCGRCFNLRWIIFISDPSGESRSIIISFETSWIDHNGFNGFLFSTNLHMEDIYIYIAKDIETEKLEKLVITYRGYHFQCIGRSSVKEKIKFE